jgi:hypothetical protein
MVGIAVASVFLVRAAGDASVYYLYASEAVEADRTSPTNSAFASPGPSYRARWRPAAANPPSTSPTESGHRDHPPRVSPAATVQEDVEVLLEGAWSGDVFEADEALIRHEAEYRHRRPATPRPGNRLMLALAGTVTVWWPSGRRSC